MTEIDRGTLESELRTLIDDLDQAAAEFADENVRWAYRHAIHRALDMAGRLGLALFNERREFENEHKANLDL